MSRRARSPASRSSCLFPRCRQCYPCGLPGRLRSHLFSGRCPVSSCLRATIPRPLTQDAVDGVPTSCCGLVLATSTSRRLLPPAVVRALSFVISDQQLVPFLRVPFMRSHVLSLAAVCLESCAELVPGAGYGVVRLGQFVVAAHQLRCCWPSGRVFSAVRDRRSVLRTAACDCVTFQVSSGGAIHQLCLGIVKSSTAQQCALPAVSLASTINSCRTVVCPQQLNSVSIASPLIHAGVPQCRQQLKALSAPRILHSAFCIPRR